MNVQQLMARAGVRDEELTNLYLTQRNIYFRRIYKAAAGLTQNKNYRFLHVGVGDDEAKIGGSSGTEITREQTNLEMGGVIPKGEIFVAYGLSIELPRTVAVADAEAFLPGELRYEEASGKVRRYLGRWVEFPAVYRPDYFFLIEPNSGATARSELRENYRRVGPAFMDGWPIFVMRGSDAEVERGSIIHQHVGADATLNADVNVDLIVHGLWFQRTGATEGRPAAR